MFIGRVILFPRLCSFAAGLCSNSSLPDNSLSASAIRSEPQTCGLGLLQVGKGYRSRRVNSANVAEATLEPQQSFIDMDNEMSLSSGIEPVNNMSILLVIIEGSTNTPKCHNQFGSPGLRPVNHNLCPNECPYIATADESRCEFQCVRQNDCGTFGNPAFTIADEETKSCRRCEMDGCRVCARSPVDACARCHEGYIKDPKGRCWRNTPEVGWNVGMCVLLVVLLYFAAWYVDLRCRDVINKEGARHGKEFREGIILHQPKDPKDKSNEKTQPYPLTTNLLKVDVAGPGTILSFNFQAMLLAWTACILVVWVVFACLVDLEHFFLGSAAWRNLYELCSIVSYGWRRQREMIAGKSILILLVYVLTTTFALCLSIRQQRSFQEIDNSETTMADFAIEVRGLPTQSGAALVEDELKELFELNTGKKVVGVSVLWKFHNKLVPVQTALEHLYNDGSGSGVSSGTGGTEVLCERPHIFKYVDDLLIWAVGAWPRKHTMSRCHGNAEVVADDSAHQEDVTALLRSLETSGDAYVVFNSEKDRDAAMAKIAGGVPFHETTISVREAIAEPDGILWENAGLADDSWPSGIVKRSIFAWGGVLCWIVFFVVVVWLPFAGIVKNASDTGMGLSTSCKVVIQFLIAVSMIAMFNLCDLLSDMCGFLQASARQAAYGVLYFAGMFIMCIIDLCLAFQLNLLTMSKLRVRSHDLTLISEMNDIVELFETYPMQKFMGDALYVYCVPFTFLLCFVCEPIFLGWLFNHITLLLVGTHPEITGTFSEKICMYLPMDLGRYADLLLNMTLTILVFAFPSSHTFHMLLWMLLGQIFIYCYDHYRVLYMVPGFMFKGKKLDDFTMYGMMIPCGLLASLFVFKSNCAWSETMMCLNPRGLAYRMFFTFCAHALLHCAFLTWVVDLFDVQKIPGPDVPYPLVSRINPQNWFTVNPIHCLRSTYIYRDDPRHHPPCSYFVRGKAHHMKENPKIGCYYSETNRADAMEELKEARESSRRFI